jgi:hypothetical protein
MSREGPISSSESSSIGAGAGGREAIRGGEGEVREEPGRAGPTTGREGPAGLDGPMEELGIRMGLGLLLPARPRARPSVAPRDARR